MGLYEKLAASHPALKAGRVHCTTCGAEQWVDSADGLQHGWPTCCGATMRLGKKP
jgi:hypothetical protein